MVQREMAQRIVAPPGSRTYGRLTVAVAQHAEARILFHVRPGSFPSRAGGDVVGAQPRRRAPRRWRPCATPALFEAVVKQAFATRRKMLRGALGRAVRRAAVAARASRRAASRDETRRAALGRRLRAPRERACRRARAVGDATMPELPEVETIVRGLAPRLRGRRVESVWWSGQPLHLRRKVDVRGLRAVAVGRAIAGVRRLGKFILVAVDGARRRGV
jgi:hypothetical protein